VNVPTLKRNTFCLDLRFVKENIRLGITAKCSKSADAYWALWEAFCHKHNIDPFVQHCDDSMSIIQVFTQPYRDGRGAPKHSAVDSGTSEDAIHVVGQTFTLLGTAETNKDAFGEIYFCIARQFHWYKNEEAPPFNPIQSNPIPTPIIIFILHQAYSSTSSEDQKTIVDMITITFNFLLCPGKYTGTTSDDMPFRLQEAELHVYDRLLDTMMASFKDLDAATPVHLMFTKQKNERMVSSRTPLHVLPRPPSVASTTFTFTKPQSPPPLPHISTTGKNITINANDITKSLHMGTTTITTITTSHQTGLHSRNIIACSLRAGSVIVLYCGRIDHNTICWTAGTVMP
jgi:hypothetical protein